MMNNHKGSEVMISILLLEILDYVAFILSATLYHGNPATKQKLWNIELTERYIYSIMHMQVQVYKSRYKSDLAVSVVSFYFKFSGIDAINKITKLRIM